MARRFHSGETEAPLLLAASSPPATIDPALYLPPALRSGACLPGRCVGGVLGAVLDLALSPHQVSCPVVHDGIWLSDAFGARQSVVFCISPILRSFCKLMPGRHCVCNVPDHARGETHSKAA